MENLIQVGNSPRHTRRGMVRGSLLCAQKLPALSADNVLFFGVEAALSAPPATPAMSVTTLEAPAAPVSSSVATSVLAATSGSRPPALLARMREFLLQQAPYDDADGDDYYYDSSSTSVIDFEDEETPVTEDFHGEETFVPASESLSPHVELMPDGQRVETFPCGGFLTKDVLGRVTEVRSARGETLWLRYSAAGKLESFVRTDARGRTHSRGELDRHGVVVRDPEGRVRASGVSMTVDPLGCFYLHTQDGQFFAVDLISGFHVERRMAAMSFCRDKYITAFFSKDGFRMATKVDCRSTESGGTSQHCGFRFYGRDGTMLEFASFDQVKSRRPSKVLPPASFPIHKTWRRQRQANSAWHSLHQYLHRVCS